MIEVFDILLGQPNGTFTPGCASLVVPILAEKLSDAKLHAASESLLTNLAQRFGLNFVFCHLMECASKQKSPKTLESNLHWMQLAMTDFGLSDLSQSGLRTFLKQTVLSHSSGGVRTSGVSLLGLLFLHVGPELRNQLTDLPAPVTVAIDAEFARLKDAKAPEPIYGPIAVSMKTEGADVERVMAASSSSFEAAEVEEKDVDARIDISELFSLDDVVTQLSHSEWKQRKEALDCIQSALEKQSAVSAPPGIDWNNFE